MTTTEIVTLLCTVFGAPVATALTGALWSLWTKLDKQATAQDRTNMEAEINAAIGAGIAVMPKVVADGITTPAARADILTAATTYFRQRFPDRALQIASAANNGDRVDDVHAAVQQTIAARLINVNLDTPVVATLGATVGAVVVPVATTLAAPSA